MNRISIGFQTYTWQMSFAKYAGEIPHILDVVHKAGLTGFEPEVCMLGSYCGHPDRLAMELGKRSLELGAICLALPWTGAMETEEEKRESEKVMCFLRHFPGTYLVLCQIPGEDRTNLRERQRNAIRCVNAVALRAYDRGIRAGCHPNSPQGSLFRTHDDYEVLLDGLVPEYAGFVPDTGHIAKGGMDVLRIFGTYKSLIKHVHFKDISAGAEWTAMGRGVIDHPALVGLLRENGFQGWIMVEEESKQAECDPDGVTIKNGGYVRENLLPLVLPCSGG